MEVNSNSPMSNIQGPQSASTFPVMLKDKLSTKTTELRQVDKNNPENLDKVKTLSKELQQMLAGTIDAESKTNATLNDPRNITQQW